MGGDGFLRQTKLIVYARSDGHIAVIIIIIIIIHLSLNRDWRVVYCHLGPCYCVLAVVITFFFFKHY